MNQLKPNIALRYLEKYQKQLQKLIDKGRFRTLSAKKRKQWISKIERLQKQLSRFSHFRQVKKVITRAAFVLSLALGNTLSAQSFNTVQTNPFGLIPSSGYIAFPDTADFDKDGDLDVIIGDDYGNLNYYENTGNTNNLVYTQSANNPFSGISAYYFAIPNLVDIDNDGDMDLFVAEYYSNVKYYENVGSVANPSFASAQINPFGIDLSAAGYFSKITFVDMDNDGDLDIISGGYSTNISYQENTGSNANPIFNTPVINPFGMTPITGYGAIPSVADIDNDGDYDLMIATYYAEFKYYQNTGTVTTPAFGVNVSNPFNLNLQSPTTYVAIPNFVDLDGDGDVDLLAGLYGNYSGEIAFAENTLISVPNNLPTGGNTSKDMNQNALLGFVASDFPFSDADPGETLSKIRFKSVPTNGQLSISGFPAGVNVEVDVAQFVQMTYTPNANYFGTDDFDFEVSDGTDFSAATYTFTININGLPTTAASSITTEQDVDYAFSTSDFTFNDVDGGNFTDVQIIVLPSKGTLKLNGNAIITGQMISVMDLPNLTYSPIAGETGFPYTDFQFAVGDGQGFSQPETMTITVEFPNSTNELLNFAAIQLSPNPVQDVATLQVQTEKATSATLSIQTLSGQLINTETIEINQNFTKTIDVSRFAKGLYIIHLQTKDGESWSEKLLVE